MAPAESEDDKLGQGRPEDASPGGPERPMSFDVTPLTTSFVAPSVDRSRGAANRADEAFSGALESSATPPIPAEVWHQVDAAARLVQSLHAQVRGVRFDVHKLDGDVVASLVDVDGGLLRPLLLTDVIDVDKLAHELGKDATS